MTQTNQSIDNMTKAGKLELLKGKVPEFKPGPISDEHLLLIMLNSIPLLSGLLNSVSGTGKSLINLSNYIKATIQGFGAVGKALGVVGTVADGLNFLTIPAVYLACYLLNIKPPFNLTNNAKFLYATVVLALGITSIFVAPAIGLPLIATVVSLGAVYNSLLFAKTIYDRYRLGKEIKDLDTRITQGYIELENIKKIAAGLDKDSEAVDALYETYEKKSKQMQEWVDLKNEKQFERKQKNMLAVLDEGVIAGLSLLAVLGAGLFLLNPVLGLTVLSAAGVVGLTYVVGRVVTKLIYDYFNPEQSKKDTKMLEIGSGESLEPAARIEEKPVADSGLNMDDVVESQNHVFARLGSTHPEFKNKNDLVDHFTTAIIQVIHQHDDPKHILLLFQKMALATEKYHTDDEFIKEIFKDIPEWSEIGPKTLNDALDQGAALLTDNEQADLKSSKALNDALMEYHVDLNRITDHTEANEERSENSIEINPVKSPHPVKE